MRCTMDPGSAAHRHSASKTRVNALMALRSIRGTHSSSWTRSGEARYCTVHCPARAVAGGRVPEAPPGRFNFGVGGPVTARPCLGGIGENLAT